MVSTSVSKKVTAKKKRKEDTKRGYQKRIPKEDTKRCRKWTEDKLEQLLNDEENCFASNLEKLAL